MYKVLKKFVDLKDNNHVYSVGDTYPHTGYEPSLVRIEELKSKDNRRKTELIVEIKDKEEIKEEVIEEKSLDEFLEKDKEETKEKKKSRSNKKVSKKK